MSKKVDAKQVEETKEPKPEFLEAFSLVRDGEYFRVATVVVDGDETIITYGDKYWHVEAVRKFKIAAGRMFDAVKRGRQ